MNACQTRQKTRQQFNAHAIDSSQRPLTADTDIEARQIRLHNTAAETLDKLVALVEQEDDGHNNG